MDEIAQLKKQNRALKKEIAALTDRLEACASLESTAAIAQAIDHSLSGIAISDNRWRIQYVNPAMIRPMGLRNVSTR